MNGGNNGKKSTITVGSSRTFTAGNGGPIVKVSSSTPVIQGPNGSVTLVVTSSSSSILSPNVSVTAASSPIIGSSAGKRIGPRVINSGKERKSEIGNKDSSSGSSSSWTHGNKESKEVTIKGDLRNIMLAFGDECMPLDESVHLMEVILKQELEAFLFICDTAALLSGSKILGLRESIYAMRNDKKYLSRLFKYLAFKDQKQRILRVNQNQKMTIQPKGYLHEVREILQDLDESGEIGKLIDTEYSIESSKTERVLRAERINQRLTIPKYITYAKARSVSFARKLIHLQEWVATYLHSECKLSQSFMEVLAFLTYEMVAQIVDLSFIIKRERMGSFNPIQRLCDTRGANPDTCMSAPAFQKKRKDDEYNSVSEILVQASELEAKRLKKVTLPNKEVLVTKSVHSLLPGEIREAYSRFQRSHPPSVSYFSRAEKIRQLNFQY